MRILAAVALCCIFLGCAGGVNHKVANSLRDRLHSENTCIIKIEDFATFPWDTMYVFSELAFRSDIERILRTDLPSYSELDQVIAFKDKGKTVYTENTPYEPSDIPDGSISYFGIVYGRVCRVIPRSEAVFRAERLFVKGNTFYSLDTLSTVQKDVAKSR